MARIAVSVLEPALRASIDPLAVDLIARLQHRADPPIRVTTTQPFSRLTALQIYRAKAAKGDRPAVRTEGYPALLAALHAAAVGEVIVHGITFADEVYLLFTDAARRQCLGMLRKRRLARRLTPGSSS